MKTHYYGGSSSEDAEQAPCGVWLGDGSGLSGEWGRVDCIRCQSRKKKINESEAAEERAIVEQMGDMAAFMRAEENSVSCKFDWVIAMTNKPMLSVELRAGLERLLENGYAQYLTKIDAIELQALLDAPAAKSHVKPVAYKFTSPGYSVCLKEYNSPECYFRDPEEWLCTPLYAEQPAPVAVVIPSQLVDTWNGNRDDMTYDKGWNDCLAEVARLNVAKP